MTAGEQRYRGVELQMVIAVVTKLCLTRCSRVRAHQFLWFLSLPFPRSADLGRYARFQTVILALKDHARSNICRCKLQEGVS
jgi:hypothetical protein